MGGLVLHGDLFFSLQSGDIRPLAHWLESVKILPPGGFPANKPANYGDVTYGAVAKIEIEDAHRARAHCLAITDEFFDPSRPSSWSGAIDQACAGSLPGDDDDRSRRLFLSPAETRLITARSIRCLLCEPLKTRLRVGTPSR